MIAVQSIVNKLKSNLDAEGSGYYDFTLDFMPAINSAIDICVTEINSFYGGKKFSETAFAEITYTKVFYTNRFSRINLPAPSMSHKIWCLLSIMPLPNFGKIVGNVFIDLTTATVVPVNPAESDVCEDPNPFFTNYAAIFVKSNYTAKRLTAEEWEKNKINPFEDGHDLETGEIVKSYAWLNLSRYHETEAGNLIEIELRPDLLNKFVAIRYIKYPQQVTAIVNNIEFPEWMEQIILNFALNFIATKQGDNTTVYQTTKNNLRELLTSIS